MKIVFITCYFDPQYVRSRVFEHALTATEGVELVIIRNTSHGLLRYPEVIWQLLKLRFSGTAVDAYWLNFRGYELLPLVLLLAGRKPVIFDEMINPVEVLTEHQKQRAGTLIGTLMGYWTIGAEFYYWLLRRCRVVLADTEAHKRYTAGQSRVPLDHYVAVPVGTDETLFKPGIVAAQKPTFQVLYYGSMVPLHGVQYVMAAATELKDIADISFLLIGKSRHYETEITIAQQGGAHVTRRDWVPFEELPQLISESAICIGGPLGGTNQAQFVITTKTYQSLACGAVTLVGHNEATAELFRDKDNSLVVAQADSLGLAETILWAYNHQADLPTIGAHGRELYELYFSSQTIQAAVKTIVSKI